MSNSNFSTMGRLGRSEEGIGIWLVVSVTVALFSFLYVVIQSVPFSRTFDTGDKNGKSSFNV